MFRKYWKWYNNTKKRSCLTVKKKNLNIKQKPKLFCNFREPSFRSASKMNHSHHRSKQTERASVKHHRLAQPKSPRHKFIRINHQAPNPPHRQLFNSTFSGSISAYRPANARAFAKSGPSPAVKTGKQHF